MSESERLDRLVRELRETLDRSRRGESPSKIAIDGDHVLVGELRPLKFGGERVLHANNVLNFNGKCRKCYDEGWTWDRHNRQGPIRVSCDACDRRDDVPESWKHHQVPTGLTPMEEAEVQRFWMSDAWLTCDE